MGLLSLRSPASELISSLRSALIDRGLLAVGKDFFGDYQLPVRFIEPSYVGGGILRVQVDVDNLPRGIYPDDLSSESTLTYLRQRLHRWVDFRYWTGSLSLHGEELSVGKGKQFWYLIELSGDNLRSIPKHVPLPLDAGGISGDIPCIRFGHGVAGLVSRDIYSLVGLLVGGASRSGKSAFLNSVICGLMRAYSPADIQFVLCDFKAAVEFGVYEGCSYLWPSFPTIISDLASFLSVCDMLRAEGLRRMSMFRGQARDIVEWNSRYPDCRLPYILFVIDEFAAVAIEVGKQAFSQVADLAARLPAAGIHLCVATQRPTVDYVPGAVKANLPTRVSFSMATQVDSDVILDGAASSVRLGAPGRFILVDGVDVLEVQSFYLSLDEVRSVVAGGVG